MNGVRYGLCYKAEINLFVSDPSYYTFGALKHEFRPNYQALKEKAQTGRKVRVIAKLVEQGAATNQTRLSARGLEAARSSLNRLGFNKQKVLPRLGVVVLEVDAQDLDGLMSSGLVDEVYEDKPVPPHLIQSMAHIGTNGYNDLGLSGNGRAVAILDTGVNIGVRSCKLP